MHPTSLSPEQIQTLLRPLAGLPSQAPPAPLRQPLHTVYGGAHLFSAGLPRKLGDLALRALTRYAPQPELLAQALGLPGDAALWAVVHERVRAKLQREPIEDLRIDFEDGYGYRPDEEEDRHAVAAAQALAEGLRAGGLPWMLGLRIKALTPEQAPRAVRTLDLFLTTLAQAHGAPPPRFVVTLPKVQAPAQVAALAVLCGALESRLGWPPGALGIELMIEAPQAVLSAEGVVAPALVTAAGGRCVALHLGAYDYTAALDITAEAQSLEHPACAFARQALQVALCGRGVCLVDGATTELPVGPHRAEALSAAQEEENQRVVWAAWRRHAASVRRALHEGYYQGWDLHPAQLVARYGAVYSFFLSGQREAAARLARFIDQAAQATRAGAVFDDAATGQGLLNFFLRGLACGALCEEEALAAGLSLTELRQRSFARILAGRRSPAG